MKVTNVFVRFDKTKVLPYPSTGSHTVNPLTELKGIQKCPWYSWALWLEQANVDQKPSVFLRLFQLMLLHHCNIIRGDQHRDGVGDIYSYGPDFPVNPRPIVDCISYRNRNLLGSIQNQRAIETALVMLIGNRGLRLVIKKTLFMPHNISNKEAKHLSLRPCNPNILQCPSSPSSSLAS